MAQAAESLRAETLPITSVVDEGRTRLLSEPLVLQVTIEDGAYFKGSIDIIKPEPAKVAEYYKPNDWNELTVSAHGRRIVLHVNGEKTADLPNDPGRQAGRLALQINPKQDLEVWFKDIELLTTEVRRIE